METFYSLQGEGYHTGKPAFFIRIGGCDVGCYWCDIKESWNADWHPIVTVSSVIKSALKVKAQVAVITGGEPLLYNLSPLTETLKKNHISTHIETSGTEELLGLFDWICLSPKKQNPPKETYYKLANELKVIIQDENDFAWAERNAEKVAKNCKLFLQPEWSAAKTITPVIIEYIKRHTHWTISLQTHKFLRIP